MFISLKRPSPLSTSLISFAPSFRNVSLKKRRSQKESRWNRIRGELSGGGSPWCALLRVFGRLVGMYSWIVVRFGRGVTWLHPENVIRPSQKTSSGWVERAKRKDRGEKEGGRGREREADLFKLIGDFDAVSWKNELLAYERIVFSRRVSPQEVSAGFR